jgi:integrase
MRAATLTPELLPKLIEAARSSRDRIKHEVVIRLLIDTGMRPSELQDLTWRSLLNADGKLSGRCVWQSGKGGKMRDTKLSIECTLALDRLLRRVPSVDTSMPSIDTGCPPSGHVLHSTRGAPYEGAALRLLIIAIGRRADLELSGYSIRHLVMTQRGRRAARNGLSAADLAAWGGWADPSSALPYIEPHTNARAVLDDPEEPGEGGRR